MHKLLYLSLALVLAVFSCHSQNKEEMSKKASQLLGSLYKEVQYQDSAVNYNIGIQIGACAFEVLVNDFIVYRNAGNRGAGSVGLSAYINTNILKSGVQTWEVRVYPPVVDGKRLTELPEGVRIELRLEKLRFLSNGDVIELAPTRELFSTPLVSKEGKEVYAQAGMPAMVYKGTFNAEVPYVLTGWSKSKDLTKLDEDILLEMLVKEYKSFGALIEKGQLNEIAKRLLKSKQETAQSLFYDEADNEQIMDWFFEIYGMDNAKLYPLEKYKMTFWGNGRMVTLERIDMLFEPALAVEYYIDDKQRYATYRLYFHIPEGSDKLEIIR